MIMTDLNPVTMTTIDGTYLALVISQNLRLAVVNSVLAAAEIHESVEDLRPFSIEWSMRLDGM